MPARSLVSVKIVDSEDQEVTSQAYLHLPTTATIGQVDAAVGAWLTLLQPCTNGQIIGCSVSLPIDTSGFATPAATGSAIANGISAKFPNLSDSSPWDFVIPARDPAVMAGNGPDQTEGATLDLFTDFMETGLTGVTFTGGYFTDSRGYQLTQNADLFRVTRKHRKQLRRGSFRVGV